MNKPSIKILDRNDYEPEELHWEFGPCPYAIQFICEGKYISFGFFDGNDLIKNLMEGLPKLKAAIEGKEPDQKEAPMSAKEKAVDALECLFAISLSEGATPLTLQTLSQTTVTRIIEAVKEDLGFSPSKEFKINIEDGPFPRVPCPTCEEAVHLKMDIGKPCEDCQRVPGIGSIIMVDRNKCCLKCGRKITGGAIYTCHDEPRLIQGYTRAQWQEIIDGEYLCEFSMVGFNGHIRVGTLDNFAKDTFKQKEHSGVDRWPYCRPARLKGVMRPMFIKPDDEDAHVVCFDKDGNPNEWGQWSFLSKWGNCKYIEL